MDVHDVHSHGCYALKQIVDSGWSLKGHGWICDMTTYEDEGLQRMNVDRENNNLEDVVVGYGCMILWIKTNYVHDYGWSLKGHGWICDITNG